MDTISRLLNELKNEDLIVDTWTAEVLDEALVLLEAGNKLEDLDSLIEPDIYREDLAKWLFLDDRRFKYCDDDDMDKNISIEARLINGQVYEIRLILKALTKYFADGGRVWIGER